MSENLLNSLALVVCAMRSLANFLEHNVNKLVQASLRNESLIGAQSPGGEHEIHKVVILLCREASVHISIVVDESSLRDLAIRASSPEKLDEVISNGLHPLFSCSYTRMGVRVVVLLEKFESNGWRSFGDYLPGVLDNGYSLVDHISLK